MAVASIANACQLLQEAAARAPATLLWLDSEAVEQRFRLSLAGFY